MPTRTLPALAALAVASLALTGCSSSTINTAGSGEPRSGGSITWAVAAEPSCFDPHFHSLLSDRAVLRNFVDSVVYQEEDGTFSPWLASDWTVSADATSYTFTIRGGVTFSDGAILDAAAVKANLDYVRDSSHGSTYATLLGSVSDINAEGSTLTLTLTQPDSSLLSSLSTVALGIIDPANLAQGDALCAPGDDLSGSGPFVISDYARGDSVTFTRNEDYAWAPESLDHEGPAYLDSVTYSFLSEDSVRIGALTSGQVQAISGIPALDVADLEDTDGLTYTNGPASASTFGFVVNGAQAPWDDPAMRQALRDSFDLTTIVESVYRGQKDRAWSWVGADSPEFDEALVDSWGNDVDGANTVLDDAGWTQRDAEGYRTKGGQRLSIAVTYDSDSVRDQRDTLIEAIQDQVATNTGIEIDFTTPTWAEVSATIADGTWSVYPATFGKVDYANSVIGTWGKYFFAATSFQPTVAIALAQDAVTTTDRAAYTRDLDGIQQYLVQDSAIFIPLVESTFQIAASDTVHGLGFDWSAGNPDGNYGVWVEQ